MSNKFEKLLDYLVNEDMDKANELFHEIVVEKSREIYENLIAEETCDDEEMDESREDDEEMDESRDEEDLDESFGDEESMYEIGGHDDLGGDASDDMLGDVEDHDAMDDGDEGGFGDDMAGDEPATKDDISDLASAIEELQAEFQALLAGEKHEEEEDPDVHGGALDDLEDEEGDEESDAEFGGEESDDEESADEAFMREYREVVGKPYSGGKVAGKSEVSGTNTSSVVSSAKGRPTTSATAKNIVQGGKGEGAMDGERTNAGPIPKSLAGGVKGEFTKGVEKNISSSSKSGMKDGADLSKNPAGHGAEKKGAGEQGGTNTKAIVDKKF